VGKRRPAALDGTAEAGVPTYRREPFDFASGRLPPLCCGHVA